MQKNIDHYSKILDFSQKSGIPIGIVLGVLEGASAFDLDNPSFITKLGISKVTLSIIKKELSAYFVPVKTKNKLSAFGIEALSQIENQPKIENLLDSAKVEEVMSLRLGPERNYDQFLGTRETIIERIKLMNQLGDLKQKKLLFLGDDDFTSIIISMFGDVAEVAVLEIDKRITTQIRSISDKYHLNINIILHDLRKNLPVEFLSHFDVVFMDPPYTPNGVKLFLSRAIQTLNYHNKATRIYFCYGNSDLAREKFVDIQKVVTDSGLMIRSVFDKFNRYTGAESIGNASSLYVCDTTPMSKPLIKGEFNANIYTND